MAESRGYHVGAAGTLGIDPTPGGILGGGSRRGDPDGARGVRELVARAMGTSSESLLRYLYVSGIVDRKVRVHRFTCAGCIAIAKSGRTASPWHSELGQSPKRPKRLGWCLNGCGAVGVETAELSSSQPVSVLVDVAPHV